MNESTGVKFSLGRLVATPGAIEAFRVADQDVGEYLRRHQAGDWGEVSPGDGKENDWSLANEARLLSAYTLSTGVKFWIISEADRSSTCILLPQEY